MRTPPSCSLMLVLVALAGVAAAQALPAGVPTITLPKSGGCTPMNVAYHPGFNQYYAHGGGNPTCDFDVFDAAGNRVYDCRCVNVDSRSLWYNPNTARLEVVSHAASSGGGGSTGLLLVGLDGAGHYDGNNTQDLAVVPGLPSSQTVPAYDPDGDLIYARDRSATVNEARRSDGQLLRTLTLDLAAAGGSSLPSYSIGYTGVSGHEIVVASNNQDAAVLFDLSGGFSALVPLPMNVSTTYSGNYANEQFFVYDSSCSCWRGFEILQHGGAAVRTVDATPDRVAQGQVGAAVSFTAENVGLNAINITGVDLGFKDAGGGDVSSEYTVQPDPGNPTALAPGATETFDFTVNVDAQATRGVITVDGSSDSVDQVVGTIFQDRSADTPDTWEVVGALPQVRVIDATPTRVGPGTSGHPVSMTVENVGLNALDVNFATLQFFDGALVDVGSEYTVTPDPGNPTSIAVGATGTFLFAVDLVMTPTLGTITLEGEIEVTDQVSGDVVTDSSADSPDTWDVAGAEPWVRVVDAVPGTVSPGGAGYQVTVSVENTGLDTILVFTVSLTFFGTADRSGEYVVTADPGNPATVTPGVTESFVFSVAVDPGATFETITLDAGFAGADVVTGAIVFDIDADVTDSWDLVTCGASMCGDCNGDGQISILDALVAAQHAAGLIALAGGDFTNCNVIGLIEPAPGAVVDVLDALTIAQNAAGLPATLACC